MTERRLAECPLFDDRMPLWLNHAMIDRVAARDGQPPLQPWVRLHAMVADAVQVRGGQNARVGVQPMIVQPMIVHAIRYQRGSMSASWCHVDCS